MRAEIEAAKAGEDSKRAVWAGEKIRQGGAQAAAEVIARAPYGYGGGAAEERVAQAVGCCNALIREGTAKAQGLMERYQQEPSGEMGNRIEAQLKELDHLEAGVQALQAQEETTTPCEL